MTLASVVGQTKSSVNNDASTSHSSFSKTPKRNLLQATEETNDFRSEKNAYGINITIFQKSPIGINSTNGGEMWLRVDWRIHSEYYRIAEVNELVSYLYDSSSGIDKNTTVYPSSYDYSNYWEIGPSVDHRRYDISVTIENGSVLSNYLDVYTEFYYSVWDEYENAECPITFVCSKSGTHLLLYSTRTEDSAFRIVIQDKNNNTVYSNVHDQNSYWAYLIACGYGIYGSNSTGSFGSTPDKLFDFDTPLSEISTVRAVYSSAYHRSEFSVFNYQNKTIIYPQSTELELQENANAGGYEKMVNTSSWMYGMGCAENGSIFWNDGWIVYHYDGQTTSYHDYTPEGFGGEWAINCQQNGQLYFSVNVGSKGTIFNVTGPTITWSMCMYERPNYGDYIRGFDVAENGTIYFHDDGNAIYRVEDNKERLIGVVSSHIDWLCLGANDSLLISTNGKIYRLENGTFVKHADPKTSLTLFAEFSEGTLVFNMNNKDIYSYLPDVITGDINRDGRVSLADLVILAQAFGSRLGEPKWNQNADIDGNGVVGLSDLVILAQHYGQHYL
jgi:hypothetical protein